jgi:hypothetical protein
LPLKKIPESILFRVRDFQQGWLVRPEAWAHMDRPRITNWGSAKVMKSLPHRYPHGILMGDEWFFEDLNILDGEVEVIL